MVEDIFRSVKSLLETRPIYHHHDETIRGHVFCSFLALVVLKELGARLDERGKRYEWAMIRQDLKALQEVEVEMEGKAWYLGLPEKVPESTLPQKEKRWLGRKWWL